MTLVLTVCSFNFSWPGELGFLCFTGAFAMYASCGLFDEDEGRRKLPRPWHAVDWLLLTLRAVSIPVALVVFAYGMGGAKVIDGQYVLTSHGEITGVITQREFLLRDLCARMMFPCVALPLCLDAAIQCRACFLLRGE